MTLTEAKDQIAQQHDFDTWAEMDKAMDESRNMHHPLNDYERWQELHGEAATLYAIEKVKEALKLAAERVSLKIRRHNEQILKGNYAYFADDMDHVEIDKDSILSLLPELIENIKNEK